MAQPVRFGLEAQLAASVRNATISVGLFDTIQKRARIFATTTHGRRREAQTLEEEAGKGRRRVWFGGDEATFIVKKRWRRNRCIAKDVTITAIFSNIPSRILWRSRYEIIGWLEESS